MSPDAITLIEQMGLDTHVSPFPKPHLEGFENPERIQMALRYLDENDVLKGILKMKTPRASCDDALLAHSPYLVHSVEVMSELGGGQLGESAYASENLLSSALHALGGALLAAELIVDESCRHSFAMIRPPGHHATTSASMGLCFFNNVAVATKNILKEDGIEKVTILDIDDHFGNGTAEIFYDDPSVQFISIHEYNHESFGLGHFRETGRGKGKGTNINIPLHESSPDSSYQLAIKKIITPAIEEFNPDVIGVSAGYDAHFTDPIGEMCIDSGTYWFIANEIERLVTSLSLKGSFWVLEGGYNPLALGPCIRATLEGLQNQNISVLEDQEEERCEDEESARRNKRLIPKIWNEISSFL
ncbi:MAG: histone deacetylase family protein [Candidatus Thorarchaeota archaeon]|jgi:acetoin utilization deacetylase AcuC-like enzyme